MDSAYLKEHVGKALALGLAEVCQKKPIDPIEYLSKWLRKHVENLKDNANEALESEELSKQREEAEEEKRRQEALLEEQNRIQNQIMKRDLEIFEEQERKQQTEDAKPSTYNVPSVTVPISPVMDEQPPDSPTSQRSQIIEASGEIENSDTEEQDVAVKTKSPEISHSPVVNEQIPSPINTSPVPPPPAGESSSPVPQEESTPHSVASTNGEDGAATAGDIDVNDDKLTDSLNIDER